MKTAEELFNLWCGNSYVWEAQNRIEQLRWIKLAEIINKEHGVAIAEGMTRAADIPRIVGCERNIEDRNPLNVCEDIRTKILTARDNLKGGV